MSDTLESEPMTSPSFPTGLPASRFPPLSGAHDYVAAESVASAAAAHGAAAPLADCTLAQEIELYADVVVAASESDGPLPEGELDRVLGVDDAPSAQGFP